jgi:hypothetical protein
MEPVQAKLPSYFPFLRILRFLRQKCFRLRPQAGLRRSAQSADNR